MKFILTFQEKFINILPKMISYNLDLLPSTKIVSYYLIQDSFIHLARAKNLIIKCD